MSPRVLAQWHRSEGVFAQFVHSRAIFEAVFRRSGRRQFFEIKNLSGGRDRTRTCDLLRVKRWFRRKLLTTLAADTAQDRFRRAGGRLTQRKRSERSALPAGGDHAPDRMRTGDRTLLTGHHKRSPSGDRLRAAIAPPEVDLRRAQRLGRSEPAREVRVEALHQGCRERIVDLPQGRDYVP